MTVGQREVFGEERQHGRQERKDKRRGKALDNVSREERSNREEEERSRGKRNQGRSPWGASGEAMGNGQAGLTQQLRLLVGQDLVEDVVVSLSL